MEVLSIDARSFIIIEFKTTAAFVARWRFLMKTQAFLCELAMFYKWYIAV